MLRSVSRNTLVWTEAFTGIVGRKSRSGGHCGPSSSSYCHPNPGRKKSQFCSFTDDNSWQNQPQPLPAVLSYVHIDDDEEYFEERTTAVVAAGRPSMVHRNNNSIQQQGYCRQVIPKNGQIPRRNSTRPTAFSEVMANSLYDEANNNLVEPSLAAAPGGDGGDNSTTTTTTTSYPPNGPPCATTTTRTTGTISYRKASSVGGSGGGGGPGRHRCPRCGTTKTFRGDLEDNAYYCVQCSEWFISANSDNKFLANNVDIGDGSSYEDFMAKQNSPKKATTTTTSTDITNEPEILMRHVSRLSRWIHLLGFA
jgi:hypothetical protein